jgi:hypothetical protein
MPLAWGHSQFGMERRAQCMTAGETTACRYGVESPHTTDDEILGPGQTQLAQPDSEAAARSSPDMPRQVPTPHASADCQRIERGGLGWISAVRLAPTRDPRQQMQAAIQPGCGALGQTPKKCRGSTFPSP